MKLELKRIFKGSEYTIGKLYIDGEYFCDTLEDTVRNLPIICPNTPKGKACKCKEKIYAETAIPAGIYKVIMSYSPRFKKILPSLQNVQHFIGILIHNGNHAEHSEGCILVGKNKVKGQVIESKNTLAKLIEKLNNVDTNTDIIIHIS